MPTLYERARAAFKAFRFSAFPSSTRSFGAQVFWPEWPSQLNPVSLEPPDLTQSSLIMAPVNWAGTVFAEPTIRVLTEDASEEWTPVEDHPLVKLWEQPNPDYSGATMLKTFAYYWLVYGNVYLVKRRDGTGEVRELRILDSKQTHPVWPVDGSEFVSGYEVRTDSTPYFFSKDDIIHFRYGLDPCNHRLGLSPVRALIDEIIADEAALGYSKKVLGNGGVPPYFVAPKANADSVFQIDAEKVKAALMVATSGGSPPVFSAPMEVTKLAFNPSEFSMKESHSVSEERVCAVLGIPSLVLNFNFENSSTYSNYQTALQAAWQSFVIPTLKLFATELTNHLLPEFQGTPGEWVEFDTREIWALQADEKLIAEREVMKWNAGLITRNEARAAMGMDGYEGDRGDEFAPVTMAKQTISEVKQFGKPYDPTAKDADEIRRWWKANAPDEAKTLLDAEVVN